MSPPRSRRAAFIVLLGMLTALGPLTIDLYLPAFPALKDDLAVGDGEVQLTLAGTTLGLAMGELVVGTLSDRVGRRWPLLAATALHVAASVGCALSTDIVTLGVLRVLQGLGAAGSAVLVLAIVRDLFRGRLLVLMLARVTLVTTVAPLIAPVLGAELLPVTGWRGIFVVLAVLSALVLAASILFLPETRPRTESSARLAPRVRAVVHDRSFLGSALVASMTYAGIYAYVAASSLLFQEVEGLTPRAYSIVFLVNSIGLVAGVQLGARLTERFSVSGVLTLFTSITLVAAGALIGVELAGIGLPGVVTLLFVFVTACGACFPCVTALALDGQGNQAGTAASLFGAFNFTVAALVAPIAGFVGITSAVPLGGVLVCTSLLAVLGTLFVVRPSQLHRARVSTVEREA